MGAERYKYPVKPVGRNSVYDDQHVSRAMLCLVPDA